MNKLFFVLFFLTPIFLNAQSFKGRVVDKKNNQPLAFVNIGVINKDIGTVSDENGNFSIDLSKSSENDTIRFSMIGYKNQEYRIKNYKIRFAESTDLLLEEEIISLKGVTIKPKDYKKKIIGNETKSKTAQAGFSQNKLGYEMGVLMHTKKTAILEKVNLNIASSTYDTIFYRLNIYKREKRESFENILKEPIYIQFEKEKIKETIQVDLSKYGIEVEGDFLVTVELVKDLGKGHLFFSCTIFGAPTFFRETSQGQWRRIPMNIGIGINVEVIVEK